MATAPQVPASENPLRAPSGPWPWILLFVAAFSLRAGLVWVLRGLQAEPSSDQAEFDAVAWNLAQGLGFSLRSPGGTLYASAVSPPLLPWIVGLLYRVTGHWYSAALLLQSALSALAPLFLAAMGGALFGRRVGLLSGWICAFHPLLVLFSSLLLTENLLVPTLLLALWLSVEWVRTARPVRAFGAGLAWGLASLARPTALLVPVVVLGWAWWSLHSALSPARRVWHSGLLVLGLAVALAPWTIRNALVFHAFVPVATRGGGALYVGNNPQVWGDPVRRGGSTDANFYKQVDRESRGLDEIQRDARTRQRALAFLGAHVGEWPAMAFAKLRRFWRISAEGGGTGRWFPPDSLFGIVVGIADPVRVWSLVVFPLALWGGVRVLRGPRPWLSSLILWVILYFNLLAVAFWGSLRMRMPIEPLIVLLVALALEDMRRRLVRAR